MKGAPALQTAGFALLCACGSVEPPAPPVVHVLDPGTDGGFPPLEGCVGDEVVSPRSGVHLLAQWPAVAPGPSAVTISTTPTSIYVSTVTYDVQTQPISRSTLTRVDRASGQASRVDLEARVGFNYTVDGPRVFWVGHIADSEQGLMFGDLDRPNVANLVDRTAAQVSPQPVSVAGSVVAYLRGPNAQRAHWWDRASGRGDDFASGDTCRLLNWSAIRGKTLVWAEGDDTDPNNSACKGPAAARTVVHFANQSVDRTVEVLGLRGRYANIITTPFDATATTAITGRRGFADVSTGAVLLDSLGLSNPDGFGIVRDHVYIASYSDESNFEVYRYDGGLQGPKAPVGAGRGVVVSTVHDTAGIYVVTLEPNEFMLWVIDMDLVGCAPK